MASLKSIKRRITGVRSTRQVMKAMNMVSASKLQKAKIRMTAAKRLLSESDRMIDNLKYSETAAEHIYVNQRKVKNTLYVVMAGDRGLCGSYNANIAGKALSHMNGGGKNEKIIAVGRQCADYFTRREKNILHRYIGTSETAFYDAAESISELILSLYNSGEADEVYIAYTKFNSVLSHTPQVERLLPLDLDADVKYNDYYMQYESGVDDFLNDAMPMYLKAFIYGVLSESAVCEQAARMVSMDSATQNATEIIDDLVYVFNRKRQSVITQEISEIINGVNMMK